jgi:P-loop containing dynein motor region
VRYGPQGAKQLTYFVDDLNMPYVDKYETQSAIELIRQSIDYHGWYDKAKILLKVRKRRRSYEWLPDRDQLSYSACQIGPSVSCWFQ